MGRTIWLVVGMAVCLVLALTTLVRAADNDQQWVAVDVNASCLSACISTSTGSDVSSGEPVLAFDLLVRLTKGPIKGLYFGVSPLYWGLDDNDWGSNFADSISYIAGWSGSCWSHGPLNDLVLKADVSYLDYYKIAHGQPGDLYDARLAVSYKRYFIVPFVQGDYRGPADRDNIGGSWAEENVIWRGGLQNTWTPFKIKAKELSLTQTVMFVTDHGTGTREVFVPRFFYEAKIVYATGNSFLGSLKFIPLLIQWHTPLKGVDPTVDNRTEHFVFGCGVSGQL